MVRMRINHLLILKGPFGSLKILYFIVIKRNTAVISPINHHHFYGRATFGWVQYISDPFALNFLAVNWSFR